MVGFSILVVLGAVKATVDGKPGVAALLAASAALCALLAWFLLREPEPSRRATLVVWGSVAGFVLAVFVVLRVLQS